VRFLVVSVVLAFALAAPAAAQDRRDRAPERRSLGADSLFGPGIVDLSANGNAVKLRLTRPAHVVVFAVGEPAVAQLVLPRRSETRVSRVGDQWIDLPWAVMSGSGAGVTTTTFVIGRVPVGAGGLPAVAGRASGAVPPGAVPPSGAAPGGTVALVIVADSVWSRDAVTALLPQSLQGSPMAMAHAIAAALMGSRTDTCAAYLVRW
jgi:hypothetical protein